MNTETVVLLSTLLINILNIFLSLFSILDEFSHRVVIHRKIESVHRSLEQSLRQQDFINQTEGAKKNKDGDIGGKEYLLRK